MPAKRGHLECQGQGNITLVQALSRLKSSYAEVPKAQLIDLLFRQKVEEGRWRKKRVLKSIVGNVAKRSVCSGDALTERAQMRELRGANKAAAAATTSAAAVPPYPHPLGATASQGSLTGFALCLGEVFEI